MYSYTHILLTFQYSNVANAFTAPLFEQWKTLLGAHMIDYNKLTVKEVLAKGMDIIK